jgi:hypothetical protein
VMMCSLSFPPAGCLSNKINVLQGGTGTLPEIYYGDLSTTFTTE